MNAQQLVLFPFMWQLTLTEAKAMIQESAEEQNDTHSAINQLSLEFRY